MNLHEEIAQLAYELFEKNGCQHGRDLDDWCEAERIVSQRHTKKSVAPQRTRRAKAGTEKTIKKTKKAPAAKAPAKTVRKKARA